MTPDRSFRSEIQGLRAIAVVSVVIFHVWPWMLPGGYVGVDVFFVISGYLITGLLVREIEATGRISILQFYERRVRRLVPAATLVLLAVALSIPLLPGSRWQDTAIENAASALYIENWRLAWLAVDYLGAENPPSPVQHYWSLSIEEQFYIFWPLLMIAGAVLARRMGAGVRTVLLALLALVTVASFVKSLVLTRTDPAQAYFVTHSRIWELGIGGLLSIARLPTPPARGRTAALGRACGDPRRRARPFRRHGFSGLRSPLTDARLRRRHPRRLGVSAVQRDAAPGGPPRAICRRHLLRGLSVALAADRLRDGPDRG